MASEVETLTADPEIRDLLGVTWMPPGLRDEHRADIEAVEAVLADPAERKRLQNPGRLAMEAKRRRQNLEAQTPPPLTASQRDKLAQFRGACEAQFTQNMPTVEAMRHRPPGTVDHHAAWTATNKRAVILWQRAGRVLDPDNRAADFNNVERFRPSVATRSLMTDAQINRPFTLSNEAKANFDQIDWTSPEVAAALQGLIAEGKIKINTGVRRGRLRQPKEGPVFECTHASHGDGGRIFSGNFAKKNWQRDRETHQRLEPGKGAS